MAVSDLVRTDLKRLLLELVPTDGTSMGNVTLKTEFFARARDDAHPEMNEDDYWTIRNSLVDDGILSIGRGRGGSVRRTSESAIVQLPLPPSSIRDLSPYSSERNLYEPFLDTLRKYFSKDYRIRDFVAEITAHQGSRTTGGKWTRPDITMVAVKMFQYVPGKTLELITFEIKPVGSWGVEGVYETASQSIFANTSYLCVHCPVPIPDGDQDRLEKEAARFGVGLMLFEDPADWETCDIRVAPEYKTPDPEETNQFISVQLSASNRERIAQLVR